MTRNVLIATLLIVSLAISVAWAQDATEVDDTGPIAVEGGPALDPPPELDAETTQFLALARAYQTSFIDLAWISTLELYATAGIIYSDFSSGAASADAALDALESPALLHGTVTLAIERIYALTPTEDSLTREELQRLAMVYDQLGVLYSVMLDQFADPTLNLAVEVEQARSEVELAISSNFATESAADSPGPVERDD